MCTAGFKNSNDFLSAEEWCLKICFLSQRVAHAFLRTEKCTLMSSTLQNCILETVNNHVSVKIFFRSNICNVQTHVNCSSYHTTRYPIVNGNKLKTAECLRVSGLRMLQD